MENTTEAGLQVVGIVCSELPQAAALLDHCGVIVWTNDTVLGREHLPTPGYPRGDDGTPTTVQVDVPVHLANHDRATLRLTQASPVEHDADDLLVLRETQHRARNLISLVMAIASQSFVDRALDPATRKFMDRLASLDAVVRVGCEADHDHCPVQTIVGQIARRFEDPGRPQFHLEGDHVSLPARWAHTLALVLHELATNAIRHGALRDPKGKVDVFWQRSVKADGDAVFNFEWREHLTTHVVPSDRKGFGSRMLRSAIETNRNCTGSIALLPSGLVYKWTLCLRAIDLPVDKG